MADEDREPTPQELVKGKSAERDGGDVGSTMYANWLVDYFRRWLHGDAKPQNNTLAMGALGMLGNRGRATEPVKYRAHNRRPPPAGIEIQPAAMPPAMATGPRPLITKPLAAVSPGHISQPPHKHANHIGHARPKPTRTQPTSTTRHERRAPKPKADPYEDLYHSMGSG